MPTPGRHTTHVLGDEPGAVGSAELARIDIGMGANGPTRRAHVAKILVAPATEHAPGDFGVDMTVVLCVRVRFQRWLRGSEKSAMLSRRTAARCEQRRNVLRRAT